DVDEFRPEPREQALAALLEEARADPPNPGNCEERLPDEGNAARFARFFAAQRPTVVYFGKLIENKGVQVVLEAIAGLDARPVVSAHSGLAEVAAGIGEEVGPETAALLSFPARDVAALRERLAAILALPVERRRELGGDARRAVEQRWSWPVVAARLLE